MLAHKSVRWRLCYLGIVLSEARKPSGWERKRLPKEPLSSLVSRAAARGADVEPENPALFVSLSANSLCRRLSGRGALW
jgi:hypothetical protein